VLLFKQANTFHNVLSEQAGGLHELDSRSSEVINNEVFQMQSSSGLFPQPLRLLHITTIKTPKNQACIIH